MTNTNIFTYDNIKLEVIFHLLKKFLEEKRNEKGNNIKEKIINSFSTVKSTVGCHQLIQVK